jgi:phage terminase large subunit-like protein
LIPGYDPASTALDGEWFDSDAAELAIAFFHECLVFIEGEKAGEPFLLEPWQQAIVAALFGWKRADGTRRYREAFIYVPRKNGKSPFCAGLTLLVAFMDGEPGAQLYSAAADREQAALIFRHCSGMISREPELASRARIHKSFRSIEFPDTLGTYKALSSDADTKHGLNAHLVIIDELHAHRDAELVDPPWWR